MTGMVPATGLLSGSLAEAARFRVMSMARESAMALRHGPADPPDEATWLAFSTSLADPMDSIALGDVGDTETGEQFIPITRILAATYDDRIRAPRPDGRWHYMTDVDGQPVTDMPELVAIVHARGIRKLNAQLIGLDESDRPVSVDNLWMLSIVYADLSWADAFLQANGDPHSVIASHGMLISGVQRGTAITDPARMAELAEAAGLPLGGTALKEPLYQILTLLTAADDELGWIAEPDGSD